MKATKEVKENKLEECRNDREAREFFQKFLGRGGFIFYKPDPEYDDYAKRWSAFSNEQKFTIIKALASEFLPQIFEHYEMKENKDYLIDYIQHYKLDEMLPTIKVRFLKPISFEEMREALLDAAWIFRSVGGIEVFDTYE